MPMDKMPSAYIPPEESLMNDELMKIELVNLQQAYKHLTTYYVAYKKDTERHTFLQNQKICELLDERRLLERIMGNMSISDKIKRDRNRRALTELFKYIRSHQEEMMIELGRLHKGNIQIDELQDKVIEQRKSMGGITGPLEYRLVQYRRRRRLDNTNNKINVLVNDKIAENKKLRDEINHIRIDRTSFHKLYRKTAIELETCKKRKADILLNTVQAQDQRQEAMTKIKVQLDRNEKETIIYEQAVRVLDRIMSHESKVNQTLAVKCNDRREFKQQEAAEKEKHQQDTLDADLKTLSNYKESYDCIREVTELDGTDAIIGRFLSQEAENFSLFKYVTQLNGQNEALGEEVSKTEKAIEKIREEKEETLAENSTTVAYTQEERDNLVVVLNGRENELSALNGGLNQLKELIWETFSRAGCSQKLLETAVGLNTEISFKNMTEYLAQIEHRTNELLNILHYVNLRKSQTTGMLPDRIDVAEFVPKSLPTFSVQLPAMTEEDENGQGVAELEVMPRDQLIECAYRDITQRAKDTIERLTREANR